MKNHLIQGQVGSAAVLLGVFLGASLTVTSAGTAWAQVTAAISGRVEDSSGAAIPGATVTATNVETGATRAVRTDESGGYRVLSLPVGQYEIRAETGGFRAAVRRGINLAVGQEAVMNFSLEVGQVAESVTVTGEAPLVNTTTTSVSGLVNEREVKDLPLNGRSFDNLITLNAGSINYTPMKTANAPTAGEGNSFSVAGRRPLENVFLLNGIEYTGASVQSNTPGGVSGQLLGIDAVREFNLVSDTYSAQYGKRAGAQVNIVTQSGTNLLHGTAFEFLRNSALDARNFFDRKLLPTDPRIPPFQRNQFGGALGGPIRKDKTFLFGNYEGFRQRLGISDVTVVPDENARLGLLPCVAAGVPACSSGNGVGTPTPVPNLDRRMLPYMSFWPKPNGENRGGGVAISYNNPKESIREDFGTTRFDHTFSDRDSFSGTFTVDDGNKVTPQTDPFFAVFAVTRSEVASLQETHLFSSQMVHTFRVGFSRSEFNYDSSPFEKSFDPQLSFVTGKNPGQITIGGSNAASVSAITSAGSNNNPGVHNARNLITYDDGFQIIHGRHQIGAGIWFQGLRINDSMASTKNGRAVFSSLGTFLQGTVSNFTVPPITTPLGFRSLEGAWYLEDSIRLRANLNLRLGLRHEFTNGFNERFGRAGNWIAGPDGVLLTSPTIGGSALTKNNARFLLSPRLGLAWDPFGKGQTSIRAGLGTYYDLQDNLEYPLSNLPPYNGAVSFLNVSLPTFVPIRPGTTPPPACGPGVTPPCTTYAPWGVEAAMKTPTVEEWNLTVEQQITPGTSLRLAYVGSRGFHHLVTVDTNAIRPLICSDPSGCSAGGVLTAAQKGAPPGVSVFDVRVPQGTQYIPALPGGAPATRPNPYLSSVGYFWLSEGNSSYNALQVDVTKRMSQGLQFRASYTWAKNLDIASAITAATSLNEAASVLDPYDVRRDWGPSALNPTSQATGNFTYELPFGKGKPWLGNASGAAGKLASGWQLNAIVTLLSGFPITPQIGSSQSGNGDTRLPDRPNLNPSFSSPKILGKVEHWFDPGAYLLPIPGTFGNAGRGILRGPGLATVDLSLFKATSLSERAKLELRAEFFNVLNRANLGLPNPIVFSGGAVSPSAGIITSTSTTSRQIQFGLKLAF